MKYYLIEIAEGDAKIAGKAVYEYDTLEGAVAAFHQKMCSAMKSELFSREQLCVINSLNSIYEKYSDVYERDQEL